jgi:hypothetical protein
VQGVVPIAHVKGHSQILTESDDRTVFGQLSGHHHALGTTNGDQRPIELVLEVGFPADRLRHKAGHRARDHAGLD